MSVFKKIDVNDNSVTPFNVYKDYDITPFNYTGSSGNGVQFLSGVFHSHSFGDPINGIHIKNEAKNPNGTYKSMVWDSVSHLYYKRSGIPSENFGGNLPEKETRDLQDTAHVISVPSTLFDLEIKPTSVKITDGYIRTMPIVFERDISTKKSYPNSTNKITTYIPPVLLADQYRFETSNSIYTNSNPSGSISPAVPTSLNQHMIVTGSGKVGTGSMLFKVNTTTIINDITHNVGNGIKLRDGADFDGKVKSNWWAHPEATNAKHGMPVYNITMWVKPPDPSVMPNGVTGAPGQSHLITRDKNSYFELNILTGSLKDEIYNPKKLVPLQMFFGATGSNCTTSESRQATSTGFGLAVDAWNLVSVQQEFWPPSPAHIGTSGSRYDELPPWGHSAAKTTVRVYRPDELAPAGYTVIKKVGYATASVNQSDWASLQTRNVTSSIQYNRSCYIGASGSRPQGAPNNNATATTKYGAFTGSVDDVRFYESKLSDTHISNLYHFPQMDLRNTPPVTASFDLFDDGYGNIIDEAIISSSFFKPLNLVGYYGFNELYTVKNKISSSADSTLHRGLGKTAIKDYSENNNNGVSDKVKFTPGIVVQQQSGSIKSADSLNYYHTNIHTGIRANFNNSGSIKIPHIPDLNLDSDDGFTISFWIKIPENQIPGINTIVGSSLHLTTGMGGNAGGTSKPCINLHSGSLAGRDYVTLMTKSGLTYEKVKNAANGELVTKIIQGPEAEISYPYHIELKNTSLEKDNKIFIPGNTCPEGTHINTVVIRRKSKTGNIFLESKSALTPLIENHVVITKNGTTLSIWINGKLDNTVVDNLDCTGNNSDLFIGDTGRSWVTGSKLISNVESSFIPPKNPFSGSLDEIRFYNTSANEQNVLSLYDNNLNSTTAYQTNKAGNVFYEHGMLTLTNNHLIKYFSGSLHQGTATVGNNVSKWDDGGSALFSNKFSLKFKNTRELYEQKILCKAKASDFNLSTNPTLRKTTNNCGDILSIQELADFATKPEFNPYVTTIGLYDDFGRLLAIAKLAKPVPKLKNVDMTFVVKFDR
tara:strand:- start:146 stop:3283 length:3138 start_codon:yes stop_codon:yes gene_type:complete